MTRSAHLTSLVLATVLMSGNLLAQEPEGDAKPPPASAENEGGEPAPEPTTDAPAEPEPTLEELFGAALQAWQEERFDVACEKFDAVVARLPFSVPGLTFQGRCHAHNGRTASAYKKFTHAKKLNLVQRVDETLRKVRADALAGHIADIEPRVPKLTLSVSNAPEHGLVIFVNNAVVTDLQMGAPYLLDPGSYTIIVRAPGFDDTKRDVTLAEGQTVELAIVLTLPPPPPVVPAPTPPSLPAPAPPAESSAPLWAWMLGGTGIVFGGMAVGFLVHSQDAIDDLEEKCSVAVPDVENGFNCDADYTQEMVDADNRRKNVFGGLAVGFGIGGAAALTASIIGFVAGENEEDATVGVTAIPNGLAGFVRFE